MRLVDADYFKERVADVVQNNNIKLETGLALMELMDELPTAYDVDMIVEQLENERYLPPLDCEDDGGYSEYAEGFNEMVDSAIEIVKSGGVSVADGKEG